jgi:hypothetical protein
MVGKEGKDNASSVGDRSSAMGEKLCHDAQDLAWLDGNFDTQLRCAKLSTSPVPKRDNPSNGVFVIIEIYVYFSR